MFPADVTLVTVCDFHRLKWDSDPSKELSAALRTLVLIFVDFTNYSVMNCTSSISLI